MSYRSRERVTARQFVRQSPAGRWWFGTAVTLLIAAIVAVANRSYWLAGVGVVLAAYCACWIVSTARYGKRSFRVWRMFFPIKDWD